LNPHVDPLQPAHDPAVGEPAIYRLAPAIVVRAAGVALVLLAIAVVALSAVTAMVGWDLWVIALLALLGLVVVAAGAWWATRRAYVVRLDRLGYEVRLVRGAGVRRARWVDVVEASTAEVRGSPCLVLALRDGRTTTVPVSVLAGERDEFVTRLRALLRRAR
jgi:alpha-beta hydrolase superfamily lysophospholipase